MLCGKISGVTVISKFDLLFGHLATMRHSAINSADGFTQVGRHPNDGVPSTTGPATLCVSDIPLDVLSVSGCFLWCNHWLLGHAKLCEDHLLLSLPGHCSGPPCSHPFGFCRCSIWHSAAKPITESTLFVPWNRHRHCHSLHKLHQLRLSVVPLSCSQFWNIFQF